MATGISSYGITLYEGTSGTMTKLCDIKDFPDLISDPNLLDVTTLSDPMQKQIFGINQSDLKPFTRSITRRIMVPLLSVDIRIRMENLTPRIITL